MSSPAPTRRALVVVGMHRSGASAVTRAARLLGAEPGDKAHAAEEASALARGSFEELVDAVNTDFLQTIGSGWDHTARIPDSVFHSDAAVHARDRIVRRLDEEFGAAPLFALKDPKIARLVPLWTDALRTFGAEPNFVVALRNPLEVARSLHKGNGIGQGQATLLWLRYTLDAERYTRNYRRSFVAYEDLLDNWRPVMRRVAEDCGFAWPRFNTVAEMEIDEILTAERRHEVARREHIAELPPWVRDIYGLLEQASAENGFDTAGADRILAELDRADFAFDRYIRELDLARREEIARREAGADQLDAERTRAGAAEQRLSEAERQLQSLRDGGVPGALDTARSRVRVLEQALGEERERLASVTDELRGQEQVVTLLRQRATERTAALDAAVAERDAADAQVRTVLGELQAIEAKWREQASAKSGAQRELEGRVATLTAERDRLAGELEHLHTERRALDETRSAMAERLDQLVASLAARDGELEAARAEGFRLEQAESEHAAELDGRTVKALLGELQGAREELTSEAQAARTTRAALLVSQAAVDAANDRLRAAAAELDTLAGELATMRSIQAERLSASAARGPGRRGGWFSWMFGARR